MEEPSLYGTPTATEKLATISVLLAGIAFIIAIFVALWKVFTKAGRPGWAAFIPIYNSYVLLKIVGRPGWWLLLLLIPFVNIIVGIMVTLDLAKAFGKSVLFGILGLLLFSPIGFLILGFGGAKYQGPGSLPATPAPTPAPTPSA
jgi:hypothetical protein